MYYFLIMWLVHGILCFFACVYKKYIFKLIISIPSRLHLNLTFTFLKTDIFEKWHLTQVYIIKVKSAVEAC